MAGRMTLQNVADAPRVSGNIEQEEMICVIY